MNFDKESKSRIFFFFFFGGGGGVEGGVGGGGGQGRPKKDKISTKPSGNYHKTTKYLIQSVFHISK